MDICEILIVLAVKNRPRLFKSDKKGLRFFKTCVNMSQPSLIEGVLGSKNLFSESWSEHPKNFSHVSTLPWQPLHIVPASLAHCPGHSCTLPRQILLKSYLKLFWRLLTLIATQQLTSNQICYQFWPYLGKILINIKYFWHFSSDKYWLREKLWVWRNFCFKKKKLKLKCFGPKKWWVQIIFGPKKTFSPKNFWTKF